MIYIGIADRGHIVNIIHKYSLIPAWCSSILQKCEPIAHHSCLCVRSEVEVLPSDTCWASLVLKASRRSSTAAEGSTNLQVEATMREKRQRSSCMKARFLLSC